MNGIAATKKEFRAKLAKVRRQVGRAGTVTAIALEHHSKEPLHHERAVVAEAARFTLEENRCTSLFRWDQLRLAYGTINGFYVARILNVLQPGESFIGVARCNHKEDEEDWEFGCMLAVFRAACKMFGARAERTRPSVLARCK